MKSIVINLLGGPGVGKSGVAGRMFGMLKNESIETEWVQEYAKRLVWEERWKALSNPYHVFGTQHESMNELLGKVDVIVTDAPILICAMHVPKYNIHFRPMVVEAFKELGRKTESHNFLLQRIYPFQPEGRTEKTMEEALALDDEMRRLLEDNNIPYEELTPTDTELNKVVKRLVRHNDIFS